MARSGYGAFPVIVCTIFLLAWYVVSDAAASQLRKNFYDDICPDVERIVRNAVKKKFKQTFVTAPATLRLMFHDCFVDGCDASIMIASSGNNTAEKDHPDNLSLAGDGFDTVIKAKAAVDNVPRCRNNVSCADILVIATRDVVNLAGGPAYSVELGRRDGLRSLSASVNGKLPRPTFNLNKLNTMFASNGLSEVDMIALSAAHSIGFSHCDQFADRLYNYSSRFVADPRMNRTYAAQLRENCPRNVDPRIAVDLDPTTPRNLDNIYYANLQRGMGLFISDQVLFSDRRSRPIVDKWAKDRIAFESAFVTALTKLGRVGVKTGRMGDIRRSCSVFNN